MDIRAVEKIRVKKSFDEFMEEEKLEEILPNSISICLKNLKEIVVDTVSPNFDNYWINIYFLKESFEEVKKIKEKNIYYNFYKKEENYFSVKFIDNGLSYYYIYLNKKEFIKNYFLSKYKISEIYSVFKVNFENLDNKILEYKNNYSLNEYYYIQKDYDRFNSIKYETEIYDRNKGSWDIFDDLNEDGSIAGRIYDDEDFDELKLDDKIYARNPKYDIVKSGVVGIDFGTKSTVVVSYSDENEGINESKTLPIRISGNDSEIERTENYENATIIHFTNLKNFIKDYNLEIGRPYTLYKDIQISLEAENILKQSLENFNINEFMLDLKQWASSKNQNKLISDETGNEIEIKGYLDLEENDIDPIEIYAYYIGCRVNNMAQYSIYLEYFLSFPVTYEMEVKNKILNSFTKGIKKSLPKSILNDEEIMKKFRVKFGASEPASYAITALKKFYVEPEIGNDIGYAVFDFGGGTTDFSYGIYREKENSKKYDYEIQELESGGDKYLGGENLLSLIAFDVFLQNREKMVKGNYKISLPINKKREIGFETFVSTSNEAEFNMKKLMEVMRNYWEEKNFEKESGKITVQFLNKEEVQNIEELDVDYERLDKILEKNIYSGIVSFLEKFKKIFKDKNVKETYIFLAGNSSKSHFVQEIFDKELTEEMKNQYNIIFKNAYAIEEENDGVIGLNSKTGVAFGLVELREGNGEVEYIPFKNTSKNEEINFKYCLGYSKKRRFIPIIEFDTPYNKWIKYDDIENETSIEVLYSSDTRAEGSEFPANECLRLRILIEENDKGSLYIRLKNPTTIEYVICEDINNFDENKIIEQIL